MEWLTAVGLQPPYANSWRTATAVRNDNAHKKAFTKITLVAPFTEGIWLREWRQECGRSRTWVVVVVVVHMVRSWVGMCSKSFVGMCSEDVNASTKALQTRRHAQSLAKTLCHVTLLLNVLPSRTHRPSCRSGMREELTEYAAAGP